MTLAGYRYMSRKAKGKEELTYTGCRWNSDPREIHLRITGKHYRVRILPLSSLTVAPCASIKGSDKAPIDFLTE